MKVATVPITGELLTEVLHLPEGVRVIGVQPDPTRHNTFLFTLIGDTLPVPDAQEGARVPVVVVRYAVRQQPGIERTLICELAAVTPADAHAAMRKTPIPRSELA